MIIFSYFSLRALQIYLWHVTQIVELYKKKRKGKSFKNCLKTDPKTGISNANPLFLLHPTSTFEQIKIECGHFMEMKFFPF